MIIEVCVTAVVMANKPSSSPASFCGDYSNLGRVSPKDELLEIAGARFFIRCNSSVPSLSPNQTVFKH